MTDRPGLDNDPDLDEVIRFWRDGQARLDRESERILARIRRILDDVDDETDPKLVVRRLKAQAARVVALSRTADLVADGSARAAREWIENEGVHQIYLAGVGVTSYPYEFVQPHREAVDALARDLFDDVLARTAFVSSDGKAWTRRVSREVAGFKVTGGQSIRQAAREFSAQMSREFRRRGVGSVVYSNGARHGFGEYGEMLLRTKTAQAYNAGTVAAGVQNGVRWFELFDGPQCGLTSHDDATLAHGQIVPAEFVLSFPVAHPNCRRSFGPRPDVTTGTAAVAPSTADLPGLSFMEAVTQATEAANRSTDTRERRRRTRRRTRRRPSRERV